MRRRVRQTVICIFPPVGENRNATRVRIAAACVGDSFPTFIRASGVSAQGVVGLLPGCRIPVTPESLLMLIYII